ncbi:hypothetical protein MSG28_000142 [Choristoneura fumiferana]|uniref:Uncharacterized protein n=1 Tax=Choristoneura fumiferana TaxID=7141 RepID=A0ACC0JZ99_CHOFU|nr:hypothetical protein MSG28_000142 [Choristoneura fumiferana]
MRGALIWPLLKRRAATASGAVEPQCTEHPGPPKSEPVREHRAGSKERGELQLELSLLCRNPPVVPICVGSECTTGCVCRQVMPFDHKRTATYYNQACSHTIAMGMEWAARTQPCWERTPVQQRCEIFDRAADLMAGRYRQKIIAAAMMGQGMTAIQAEHNICQLIDYTRFNSNFLRDLTMSRCVTDGAPTGKNLNHYHGLEGFFAAITPNDSFSNAGQLAITPAIMGNGVVWKPSQYSILACYRIFQSLLEAGLPVGVINFVPAEENCFLNTACCSRKLAGVAFGGTTSALETIWKRIGDNIKNFDRNHDLLPSILPTAASAIHLNRFPRIAGTGSGKNFHIIHESADMKCAVANTIRAAFEMAGQKTTSCSRAYVHHSVLRVFLLALSCQLPRLFITHPLDYRCFTSSVISAEAYDRVVGYLNTYVHDGQCELMVGGRADCSVGYYIEPTVIQASCPDHPLLLQELRGPVLTVYPFGDLVDLVEAVGMAPYAVCGSVFATEAKGPLRSTVSTGDVLCEDG